MPVQNIINVVEALEGRRMRATEVRRLFAGYIEHGYVTLNGDDVYTVTDTAAQRFGFDRPAQAMNFDPDKNKAAEPSPAALSFFSNQEGGGPIGAATTLTS